MIMRKMIKNKRGMNLMYQVIVHLILIALIFAMFFMASVNKVNSKVVKQQVLEKQIALMIDSAVPGTTFSVMKSNKWGIISDVQIKEGRVIVSVDLGGADNGYPYFSKYAVSADLDEQRFYIRVK